MALPGDENNNTEEPKVEVTETEEEVQTEVIADPHPSSGMYQYMQDYIDTKDDKKDEEEAFKLEKFNEEENKQFLEFMEGKVAEGAKLTEEDLALYKFNEEELTQVKKAFPDKFNTVEREDFPTKLEEMEAPALIEEVKKNQRLVSSKDALIKELEEKVNGLSDSGTSISDEKLKSFITDIKSDLKGGWKKHAKELELPDLSLVQASTSEGSVEDRVLQYQEGELRSEIEKEFGLEKGEFEPVKEDLYTPKTASYRWRERTEAKERELRDELKTQVEREAKQMEDVQKQQVADIKWFADSYLDGKTESAEEVVKELNTIPERIAKGELTPDKHPFALRNLMLGVKHESLVKQAVDKAVAELTKEFNDKGIYLEGKEMPTDVSQAKAPKGSNGANVKFDKKTISNSPMLRNINDLLNS